MRLFIIFVVLLIGVVWFQTDRNKSLLLVFLVLIGTLVWLQSGQSNCDLRVLNTEQWLRCLVQ